MGVTLCYGYQSWSHEPVMQGLNTGDINEGQRSSRSNGLYFVLWPPNLVKCANAISGETCGSRTALFWIIMITTW